MHSVKFRALAAAVALMSVVCLTCFMQFSTDGIHEDTDGGSSMQTQILCAPSPAHDAVETSAQPITVRSTYALALCRTSAELKALSCEAHSRRDDRTDNHRPSLHRLCRMTSGDPDSGY